MALPVRGTARRIRTEFLLPCSPQLGKPVRKGREALLGKFPLQSVPAQFRPDAQRPLSPGGMIGYEILGVAPVIEQFFGAEGLD